MERIELKQLHVSWNCAEPLFASALLLLLTPPFFVSLCKESLVLPLPPRPLDWIARWGEENKDLPQTRREKNLSLFPFLRAHSAQNVESTLWSNSRLCAPLRLSVRAREIGELLAASAASALFAYLITLFASCALQIMFLGSTQYTSYHGGRELKIYNPFQ